MGLFDKSKQRAAMRRLLRGRVTCQVSQDLQFGNAMLQAEVESTCVPSISWDVCRAASKMSKSSSLITIAQRLREDLSGLRFGPPVYHVYNPLTYAWAAHRKYLARFGKGRHPVLIVGMNPGYFGMVQTGVPFGDVTMVRDWLEIHERVRRPQTEHPKRPIEGFACRRRERLSRCP